MRMQCGQQYRIGNFACVASMLFLAMLPATTASSESTEHSDQLPTPVTAIPRLLDDWKLRFLGREGSDAELRAAVEAQRPHVAGKRDPFTVLADLSCNERMARNEVVIWEDDQFMAIVDAFDQGPKLLLVPKQRANFPIDLADLELKRLAKVAAAACDALIVAGGETVDNPSMCSLYVNPPAGLMLSQLHVHVRALAGSNGTSDGSFLQRAAAHMRMLVKGKGCV